MKTTNYFLQIIILICLTTFCIYKKTHPVYVGNVMSSGYDLGVSTSNDSIGWLSDQKGFMKMDYPAGQSWGSVFITVGKIKDLPLKPIVDISGFKKLSLDLKSEAENQILEIGLKDAQDDDSGTETKVSLNLTKEWKTYEIELSKFTSADLKKIYVLTEFVFTGNNAQSVCFRNIQFK